MFFIKNRKIRQKVIRLRKRGQIYYPLYDIIVTFKDNRNRGRFIEKLGFVNPNGPNKTVFLNTGRLAFWISNGTLINNTVRKYMVKFLVNGF